MISSFDPTPATWDLINMSDGYTLIGDFMTAAVAASLLGRGQYAIDELGADDPRAMPIFLLGDFDSWFATTFGAPFAEVLEHVWNERTEALAACLDSVLIGSRAEYERLIAHVPDDGRAAFAADWHDTRRSSLNDIGARARAWADKARRHHDKLTRDDAGVECPTA